MVITGDLSQAKDLSSVSEFPLEGESVIANGSKLKIVDAFMHRGELHVHVAQR